MITATYIAKEAERLKNTPQPNRKSKIHYHWLRCVYWQEKPTDTEDIEKVTCKRCLKRVGK